MAVGATDSAPENSSIEIYLRVRPVLKPASNLSIDTEENRAEFTIPKTLTSGFVNNLREQHNFRFDGVFSPDATQDEVFDTVAQQVVLGSMDGFNGTIFAFGQTGSGKTFTMTGGPERHADRGLIPRAISSAFSIAAERADETFKIRISYLEIYNEVGYDLLDPGRNVRSLEDLPRVHAMEDEDGNVHLRNLGLHRVESEEDALNLLFLGDTNRAISTTPMNLASSRSHCVFTLHVESRKVGDEMVRRSKLNLVDLAGSERVTRSKLDGTILREAKYINLSLHYLEQVIIALQERSQGGFRVHVPYRNSMMTTVLRDSLGGNTRTVMVATITGALQQLEESISTCRFAQRVALVTNKVTLNEEADPLLVIQRLQLKNRGLREEIRHLRGEANSEDPLSDEELAFVKTAVAGFIADQDPNATLTLAGGARAHVAAFSALRDMVRAGHLGGKSNDAEGQTAAKLHAPYTDSLKAQVRQRDSEISVLMALLERQKALRSSSLETALQSSAGASLTLPTAAISTEARETAAVPVAGGRSGRIPTARLSAEPGSQSSQDKIRLPAMAAGPAHLPQSQSEPGGRDTRDGGKLLSPEGKDLPAATDNSGVLSPRASNEVAGSVPPEGKLPVTGSQQLEAVQGEGSRGGYAPKIAVVKQTSLAREGEGSGGQYASKFDKQTSLASSSIDESQARVPASTVAGGADTACTLVLEPGQPGGFLGGNETENSARALETGKIANIADSSMDKASPRAFEAFMRQYGSAEMLQQMRSDLSARCQVAQALAKEAQQGKRRAAALRVQLERRMIQRAMSASGTLSEAAKSDDTAAMQAELQQEKDRYKEAIVKLRALKPEIESLHAELQSGHKRVLADFAAWNSTPMQLRDSDSLAATDAQPGIAAFPTEQQRADSLATADAQPGIAVAPPAEPPRMDSLAEAGAQPGIAAACAAEPPGMDSLAEASTQPSIAAAPPGRIPREADTQGLMDSLPAECKPQDDRSGSDAVLPVDVSPGWPDKERMRAAYLLEHAHLASGMEARLAFHKEWTSDIALQANRTHLANNVTSETAARLRTQPGGCLKKSSPDQEEQQVDLSPDESSEVPRYQDEVQGCAEEDMVVPRYRDEVQGCAEEDKEVQRYRHEMVGGRVHCCHLSWSGNFLSSIQP